MFIGHGERRTIDAVVFDLDGTLIKSAIDFRRMKKAVLDYLRTLPLPWDLIDEKGSMAENILKAKDHLDVHPAPSSLLPEMERRIEDICTEVELSTVARTEVLDDSASAIGWLKDRGMKVGILTRASRAYSLEVLRRVDLGGPYDAMICRDDHSLWEAKPNHIALERVAGMLDAKVERCLMVGDHYLDMKCAQEAGSPFVGVLTGSFDEKRWRDHGLEWLIGSVGDLRDVLYE